MAELVPPAPAAGAVKVKTANIRKHLRRDQAAAARKARSSSLAAGDLAKEKLVSSLSQLMISQTRHNSGRFRTAKAEGGARNQACESGREAPVFVRDAGDEAGHGGERGGRVLLGRRPCSFLFLTTACSEIRPLFVISQLEKMDAFFAPSGPKCLLFYYEEHRTNNPDGKHTFRPATRVLSQTCKSAIVIDREICLLHAGKPGKLVKKLYITDGTKEKFPGLGLFFLRITTKPITVANIAQELYFGALEGDDLLEALERLIAGVFLPALKEQTNWGALSNDANGHVLKENFLGKLAGFVAILSNARASIADAVELSRCTHTGLAAVTSPADILAAAGSAEMVEAAEATAQQWCKEITQILTKSEQMRKEADTVGPRAELEHWKKRMAKFDSLTFCVKSPQCRAVINVLVAAKSKVLQV